MKKTLFAESADTVTNLNRTAINRPLSVTARCESTGHYSLGMLDLTGSSMSKFISLVTYHVAIDLRASTSLVKYIIEITMYMAVLNLYAQKMT